MIVVADACPIIFLAKLDRLALIPDVFPGTVLVPTTIQHELLDVQIPLPERERIEAFLAECRIERVRTRRFAAAALSLADRHVLALSAEHPRAVVLTDDSLVRRVAQAEGMTVAGTLGLIIRAVQANIMPGSKAIDAVESLVADHQLRISVELYQEAMRQLGRR